MRHIITASLLLLLLLALSSVVPSHAAPPPVPAEAEAEWEVEKIVLHRDNGKGEAGDETSWFYPSDHVHHVLVRFKSLKVGLLKPVAKFISVNTAAGRDLVIAESPSETALVGNEYKGSLTLERDFPVGYYRFELAINGKPVAATNYCVMDKPADFKIYDYSLHLPDTDGELGEEVKGFTTANRHLYLSVRTSGIVPGTRLKWIWRALETEKGPGEITSAEGLLQEVGIFNLSPDLRLENPLPVGSYSLEMYLDGTPIASFPFGVEK
ncbi:MAG TPA: hypothetical protein PLU72_14090 [Candidatus Ozemobacteraceae bacterium]|nr:hypothetical protein [Candidatus Ozemobacteraceae bacterium]